MRLARVRVSTRRSPSEEWRGHCERLEGLVGASDDGDDHDRRRSRAVEGMDVEQSMARARRWRRRRETYVLFVVSRLLLLLWAHKAGCHDRPAQQRVIQSGRVPLAAGRRTAIDGHDRGADNAVLYRRADALGTVPGGDWAASGPGEPVFQDVRRAIRCSPLNMTKRGEVRAGVRRCMRRAALAACALRA